MSFTLPLSSSSSSSSSTTTTSSRRGRRSSSSSSSGSMADCLIYSEFVCVCAYCIVCREFKDVVFEDVVFDNNRFYLIIYLDFT